MEWEQLTPDNDGTRKVFEGVSEIGVGYPEVVVVVGQDTEGQLRARSFAAPSGERDPNAGDPSEHMGELRVFGALLEINSPRRCYWNGNRWVCF